MLVTASRTAFRSVIYVANPVVLERCVHSVHLHETMWIIDSKYSGDRTRYLVRRYSE